MCRHPTGCFRFFEPKHRSYECPRQFTLSKPVGRGPARRVARCPVFVSAAPAPTTLRRPRALKQVGSLIEALDEDGGAQCGEGMLSSNRRPVSRQGCVSSTGRFPSTAEADLNHAVFISFGSNRPAVTARQVLEEVTRFYDVEAHSMEIMTAAVEDILLVLPDQTTTNQVFNRGSPLLGPGFSFTSHSGPDSLMPRELSYRPSSMSSSEAFWPTAGSWLRRNSS
jgi:hypothetical protein